MRYIGILVMCLAIIMLSKSCQDNKYKLTGTIVDKYKARSREYDSDGGDYYSDKLYVVVKYNDGHIERHDEDENYYYICQINQTITEYRVVDHLTFMGWVYLLLIPGGWVFYGILYSRNYDKKGYNRGF